MAPVDANSGPPSIAALERLSVKKILLVLAIIATPATAKDADIIQLKGHEIACDALEQIASYEVVYTAEGHCGYIDEGTILEVTKRANLNDTSYLCVRPKDSWFWISCRWFHALRRDGY